MLDKIIAQIVIAFVLRQIEKAGEAVDWAKVKADAVAHVNAVLPPWLGWFQGPIDDIVMAVVDDCALALKDAADLKALVAACVAQDWPGAWQVLKDLLAKVVTPHAASTAAIA